MRRIDAEGLTLAEVLDQLSGGWAVLTVRGVDVAVISRPEQVDAAAIGVLLEAFEADLAGWPECGPPSPRSGVSRTDGP